MEKINDKIKSSNDLNLYTELSFISRELEQELKETENGNKFMDSFRTLLENFHSYLTKNSQLVEVIQQYNQTMFANAQKLKQISTQASYDKDEIASLTQEFERIVKIMEQAKKQTDSTSLSIRSYQEEIDFYLKKQTEEIERDKEKAQIQIDNDAIRDEIGKNEVEIENLKEEIMEAKCKLSEQERQLSDITKTNELVEGEYKESKDLYKKLRQENMDSLPTLSDVQTQIEESTVDLEEITKKVKEYVIDPGLAKQISLLKLELKAAKGELEKKQEIIAIKKKALAQVQKMCNNNISYMEKIKQKIEKDDERMVELQKDLDAQLAIRSEVEPKYKEVEAKWKQTKEAKQNARKENSDVVKKIVELGFENLKVTNDLNLNTRKVQANDMMISQLKNNIQQSEHEMIEVKNQQQVIFSEQMIIRAQQQKMMEKASVLLSEIQSKEKERSLTQIQTHGMTQEVQSIQEQHSVKLQQLKEIQEKTERQSQLVDRIKQERNTLKTQMEMANSETLVLREQLNDVITSIKSMTARIDHLIEIAQKEHDAALVIKDSNEHIEKMKKSCEDGLKTSEKVNKTLIEESVSLLNLLRKSEWDFKQQRKEYVMLVNSYHIVVAQLEQKKKEIQDITSEIKSQEAVLAKSKLQYNEKIQTILDLRADYEYYDEINERLSKLLDHTNALKQDEHQLYQKLTNEQLKRSTLIAEMDRPRNVHRLTLLKATNPELANQYKYLMVLKNNLVETSKELEKVREEKKKVEEEFQKMQQPQKEGPSPSYIMAQMKVYEDDIKEKDQMIKEMRMSLRDGSSSLFDTSTTIGKARESLTRRRGATAHLKSRNMLKVQENEDNYFITEAPVACVSSFGGGFMPRAPQTARESTRRFGNTTNNQSSTFNENDLVTQTTRQSRGSLYRPFLPRMTQQRARSPPVSARSYRSSVLVN